MWNSTSTVTVSIHSTMAARLGERFYDIESLSASDFAAAGWTLSIGSGSYDMWLTFLLADNGDSLIGHSYGGHGLDEAYQFIRQVTADLRSRDSRSLLQRPVVQRRICGS